MKLQKRWVILVVLIVCGVYILSNYTVEGLGNIRLRPRPTASNQYPSSNHLWSPELNHYTGISLPNSNSSWPDSPHVSNNSAPSQFSAASNLPPANSNANFNNPKPEISVPSHPSLDQWNRGLPTTAPLSSAPIPSSPLSSAPLPSTAPNFPSTAPNKPVETPVATTAPGDITKQLSIGEKLAMWESKNAVNVPVPATNLSASNNVLGTASSNLLGAASAGRSIRVATFNMEFNDSKLAPPALEMYARVIHLFDVVAIQGIQSGRDDLMPALVELLNANGKRFDYLVGPRVGRANSFEQYGFVFNTQTVETDRYLMYTIEDPEELMFYDPLVACFRAMGAPTSEAFTFSVINARLHPSFAEAERKLLPNLVDAITQDGRGEDDWVLAGDFQAADSQLRLFEDARVALIEKPTTTDGNAMQDNLLFSSRATVEFTGKTGVYDFLRHFNLSIDSAVRVSRHLPVWAEFSVREGAEPGRIASPAPVQ